MAFVPNWLVLFVKEPRMGRTKTRLARGIGTVAATRFASQTTKDLIRRLSADPRWRLVLAVTPDPAVASRVWPMTVPRIKQGPGDLGARMGRVFKILPPGRAVIIGSDVPDITPGHVAEAFKALGRGDAVFGPARDGGYWLIGLNRLRNFPGLFDNVRWSSEYALEDTVKSLGSRCRCAFIATLSDIDTAEDFIRWRRKKSRRA